MSSNYWNNKTVMITGASAGIGRGLALAIAARGGRLGLLARREDVLNDLVAEIKNEMARRWPRLLTCAIRKRCVRPRIGFARSLVQST